MTILLDQVKLANSLKIGRNEDTVFSSAPGYKNQGTTIQMLAIKMPVENARGEFLCQPVIKLTDNQSKETTYTSLANVIYFKGDLQVNEEVVKRGKAKI